MGTFMNNRTFNLPGILMMLGMIAATACTARGYTIEGKLTGDTDGARAYLYEGWDTRLKPEMLIDSIDIKDGTFGFRGDNSAPFFTVRILSSEMLANLDRNTRGHIVPLLIENEHVIIEATLEEIELEPWSNVLQYDFSNVSVTGSPLNDSYMAYMTGVVEEIRATYERNSEFYEAMYSENTRDHSWYMDNVARIQADGEQSKETKKQLIRENAGNYLGLYVYSDCIQMFDLTELEEYETVLSDRVKNSAYGQKILARAAEVKKTATGAHYTDLALIDRDGNPVNLSNHLQEGKYVLVDFWASWCGPCRGQIPHLKNVYERYSPEGWEIVNISVDEKNEDWLKALDEEQMPWIQLGCAEGTVPDVRGTYGVSFIPFSLFIGPDGEIIGKHFMGPWLDKKLIDIYGNRFD